MVAVVILLRVRLARLGSLKVMLHGIISATQRCNIGLNSWNIVPTLQRFVPTTTATSTRTANNRLDWQNSNPHVHRAFLPSLHDYDVKMSNFSFYGGRELKATTFLFFS